MTEDPAGSTREAPDGYAILHLNADKEYGMDGYYMLGPYPPVEPLVQFLIRNLECSCETRIVPVYFPIGVRMSMVVDGADVSTGVIHIPGPLPGSEANN